VSPKGGHSPLAIGTSSRWSVAVTFLGTQQILMKAYFVKYVYLPLKFCYKKVRDISEFLCGKVSLEGYMKTKNSFFSIFLINVVILSLGILLVELVFGNWIVKDRLNRLNIIRSAEIDYDIEGLYESSFKTSRYTRDQYGLRGAFQRPSEIDILTVGGSTTDQRYIADGLTWQDVIQKSFQAEGRDIVVGNAGVDGQSTYGHIKNFEWWFPHVHGLNPKYVVFSIGLNDFYKDEGFGYDALVKKDRKKAFKEVLSEKSAVYHVLRTLSGIYKAEVVEEIGHEFVDFSKLEWTHSPLQRDWRSLMATRLKEYGERVSFLIFKTREFGSIPILVTQPSHKHRIKDGKIEGVKHASEYESLPINGVDHYYMMRISDGVACSVAAKHDVMCVDMGGETFWEDSDFYDYAHMTPQGTEKTGKYLHAMLKDFIHLQN